MKTRSKALVFAAAVLAVSAAAAQPTGGYDRMGPGMMGGGYGMMGWGEPGPGSGCDFGDGAGWGRGGYYGMGPGMMGGYGGWAGAYAGLDLTADQRQKIADIEQQTRQATWKLMGTMHEQAYQMGGMGMMGGPNVDEATARKAYQAMADTRKAMFELQLDARKRIDAVLTAKQREQLQRGWGPR